MRLVFSALLLVSCISLTGQKKVLIEKFTNFSCGTCPNGTLLLQELEAENPDVIWVLHHKPVGWTDNELENDQSVTLWNDLNGPGNPTAMFNRVPKGNGLVSTMSSWRTELEKQLTTPYYAQIAITEVLFNQENRLLEFDVAISFDDIPASKDFAISAFVIEDQVESMEQHSYFNNVPGHPLEGKGDIIWNYKHSNAVRAILDEPWGSNTVIPTEPVLGETYLSSYSYQIPASYDVNNMKLVALISNKDDLSILNREVYNSTQVVLSEIGITSAEELANTVDIVISPNPAGQFVNFSLSELPQSISIYNSEGRAIVTSVPADLHHRIAVSSLAPGTYLVKLQFSDKLQVRKLSIVR